jgi:Phosphodiester glycosidase
MKRRRLLLVFPALLVAALVIYCLNLRSPVLPTEIYQGVTYGCERLAADEEGSGLMHWVRVDLTAPGIELYVTPLDPQAVQRGWQFRLEHTGTVAIKEKLAVAINATLFSSNSGWIRRTGDLARSIDATIADYVVSHIPEYTYLLCFDDHLAPYFETSRPPNEAVLKRSRWGVGGQGGPMLSHGRIFEGTPHKPTDARTAAGIDSEKRLLFLAVFENASEWRALEKLTELGAVDGMLLDGGNSTSMALGQRAHGVRPGVLTGDWRPVATHFGIRARELPPK